MNEQIYTNYRLQLPDQEVIGTLVVRDGAIADIQPGIVAQGQNGEGEYLLPGLIELHTDNLEQCMAPRPKVKWPLEAAAVYHDRDLVGAGVTTVCDAIALGDFDPTSARMTHFGPMIDVISAGQLANRFACDHRIHLRCELSYENVFDVAEQYADNPLLSLISLMDHTPGQRQFVDLEKFKVYYMGKRGMTEQEVDDFIAQTRQTQRQYGDHNRKLLVAMSKDRNIPLASHDDATVEHVHQALQEGAAIAEFPTTVDAAKEAHSHDLQVLMGSPNLILGGSHSGNVSAMELIERNLVDILSSDYVPQSLLPAIFLVTHQTGRPIYETMRLITCNPAKAIGLDGDRGSLEIGKRADFITVHDDGIVPRILSVVKQGQRVA